mmetsp:Transcript_15771/g.31427  ORF Transcript_15771/g.31427 Transcript_15771/m.31427 type:complete len:118 (+) Transcript_15771:123-476(+)
MLKIYFTDEKQTKFSNTSFNYSCYCPSSNFKNTSNIKSLICREIKTHTTTFETAILLFPQIFSVQSTQTRSDHCLTPTPDCITRFGDSDIVITTLDFHGPFNFVTVTNSLQRRILVH